MNFSTLRGYNTMRKQAEQLQDLLKKARSELRKAKKDGKSKATITKRTKIVDQAKEALEKKLISIAKAEKELKIPKSKRFLQPKETTTDKKTSSKTENKKTIKKSKGRTVVKAPTDLDKNITSQKKATEKLKTKIITAKDKAKKLAENPKMKKSGWKLSPNGNYLGKFGNDKETIIYFLFLDIGTTDVKKFTILTWNTKTKQYVDRFRTNELEEVLNYDYKHKKGVNNLGDIIEKHVGW